MTLLAPARPFEVPGTTTDSLAINAGRRLPGPDRLWVVDFSQIWGGTSWLYFAFVIDHESHQCLGWAPHRSPHGDLVRDALVQAVTARSTRATAAGESVGDFAPSVPVVFSRGCHTAEIEFPQWAIPSASDAAACGSFVAGMRRELVDKQEENEERAWASVPEATRAIAHWIEEIYNPRHDLPVAVAG